MLDRNQLQKGDRVLEIDFKGDIARMAVVSAGNKYIACQRLRDDGTTYGKVRKYNNDNFMGLIDYSQWHLFLGTEDEYRQQMENEKKCDTICREIETKIDEGLGYEKLNAILIIIDSPTLSDALAKLCPPACAGSD